MRHCKGHRTNILGEGNSRDKGSEAGKGKAPWKDPSDRSSEGKGWREVTHSRPGGQTRGEGRRHSKDMLRPSSSLFLRGIGHFPSVCQGKPGRLSFPHRPWDSGLWKPQFAHPEKKEENTLSYRER